MTRVVVIGAGIAGLTTCLRLAAAGAQVTLLTKGIGGLQLSQGTVDIFGYAPHRVGCPLEAVGDVARDKPDHPYAVIGAEAVRTGAEFLRDAVGPDLLTGDVGSNHQLPTAVGAVRPTCLAQPSMIAGECRDGARFTIVGLRQLKDFPAALIAGNLARTVLDGGGRMSARHVVVDFPARDGEADSSGLVYARAFDDEGFRGRFAELVASLVTDGEVVGLPAVLGLNDRSAWRDLADRIGHPVFEIPLPPPSVPGMRLNETLTAAVKAARVRVVLGSRVTGVDAEPGRVRAVSIAAAGGPRKFAADAFVLAAGGFESGGLVLDSYGRVSETIFGLPLAGLPEAPDELVVGEFWGAEQPLFAVGVRVDERMRPLGADATPVYANLHAAGGVLAGAQRWSEKSGEGIALGSAVRAADAIVEESE
ncbi:glycerol-3-phosphate dehydrogenase subunit GlpB [Brooklawnia cerclae]|uniref:Glycerol-3-phosphate dehydrogenase subunit B n=1 Tax=Brooklawnia cerclae TaxID=349934 RepID=A0ABX0SIF2_9ACTN|nr:glycerol-3-phosphate dehydrogenase subunit GlpB [Brooklawnia cerclae]NIH58175.1 glycerol-3-phosphate dehydrogenase subunit B [Brooklawnia cerclae]